jgi:protein arginine N-methyltransferase 1
MYSIAGHVSFLSDRVRIQSYARALERAVRPASVVIDLGTGTGIFALLACRFGARKVYAIDPSDVIQVAKEVAADNGYAERIQFLQELSTRAVLPEKADVIVSDMHGVLPWFQHHIPAIVDARKRFLVPGGKLIPEREIFCAVPVEEPEVYRDIAGSWEETGDGPELSRVRQMATNSWRKVKVSPEQLLAAPECLATLNYSTVEDANLLARATWITTRAGTGHGFVAWFDSVLADGVEFSNSPFAEEVIYGKALFPWTEPVALLAGDSISLSLQSNLVGEDYVWGWQTRISRAGLVMASFQQSTFYGTPITPLTLRKRAADYLPTLNVEGQIDEFVLALMKRHVSLAAIARRVARRFPQRFAKWEEALGRVSELSKKYS